MANEISIQATLTLLKGFHSVKHMPATFQVTQTGVGAAQGTQIVPTSDTVVSLTGISNAGWAHFTNVDATNYIEIGPTVAGAIAPFLRLYPGQSAVLRLTPAVVVRAQANTGSVKLQYSILEV